MKVDERITHMKLKSSRINALKCLFHSRLLYFDISKSAINEFTKDPTTLNKFQEDFGVTLDTSGVGADPIHYCLTGEIKYETAPSSDDQSTSGNTTIDENSKKNQNIQDQILTFDVTNGLLTGGDSCRYCLENCPANQ